jgi:ferredoxin
VQEAIERGYTPSLALLRFYTERAYTIPSTSMKVIPCPAQTRHVKCINCRLCMHSLPKGSVIGLQLHGVGASRAARRIPALGQESLF